MDYQYLKDQYGTPLYVYDIDKVKLIIKDYKENFKSNLYKTEVIYASKAFCVKEFLRIIDCEGLSLDAVSLGELYTAKAVNFDFSRVYFHGNNKTDEELRFALNNKVGHIVVDNYLELNRLEELTKLLGIKANILIRLNVGVEAHTHQYIVTAHVDSKFGVLYNSDDYLKMLYLINNSKNLHLCGFHSHIGSQIFDLNAYSAEIAKLIRICKDFSYPLVLNLGGGFGVRYTLADSPVEPKITCKSLIDTINDEVLKNGVELEKVCIEPGRSIAGEAGSTLYTIGDIKKTPNKLYYFIDGGMTDNIRPALYGANYTADIVGKEKEFKKNLVTIAGKCCESGDIIIDGILLPEANSGDLLVTYTTGAYGYSMSSNYNKALTPAVVFKEAGGYRLAVKRQTLEELIEREI